MKLEKKRNSRQEGETDRERIYIYSKRRNYFNRKEVICVYRRKTEKDECWHEDDRGFDLIELVT